MLVFSRVNKNKCPGQKFLLRRRDRDGLCEYIRIHFPSLLTFGKSLQPKADILKLPCLRQNSCAELLGECLHKVLILLTHYWWHVSLLQICDLNERNG